MSKDKLSKAQTGKSVSEPNLLSEKGLQESFGGYSNNVDVTPLPINEATPYFPNIKTNNLDAGDPTDIYINKYKDFIQSVNAPVDSRFSTPITLDAYAENESGRYPYFKPGEDNEERYAMRQSFGEKMVNGVAKGLWLTASTFAQSTVGLVNGAFQAINDGKFSSFYDNDLNNWLDSVSKKSEDYFPNYYTKEERDAKFYSPKYWATGNFLWDGVVKNLGFAAGAALSGAAFTQALKAIPLTARLFATGNGAQAATATAEGVVAGTTNKVANTLGKIRTLSDDFLGSYNAMNPGGRALVAGLATSGEAGIEALHSSNEFRQELINEHIAKYGLPPTGEALNRINAATEGAGNSTFFANMALLSATNYIQFPRILGSTYTGEKEIINGLTREIEKDLVYEGGKLARKVSKYPFLSRLNKVRPYTFSTTEAFEEVSQYSATVATQDYYNKAKNNEATSWLDSIGVGITKGAFSNEGAKNALIGGISGRIMTAGIIPGQKQGMIQQARAKRKATDSAIKEINETSLDLAVRENVQTSDFSRETKQSLNRSSKLQEERLDSIENGEVMKSKDLEADEMINYLTARVKYGRYDLVMADLADYKTLASTEAGFDQLVKEGKALESDTREAYQERLARFEETAQNFNSLWKSLNLRYSSEYVTDNNGDPVEINGKKIRKYSASVMDKMLYAATKVSDFDSRISSTSLKLASAGINTSAVIDSIVNGDFEAYNEAVDTIKNLDVISETKDELGSTLDDMAEMVGKRQEFIKTYEEVKSNPSKFREFEVREESPLTTKQTIKIKTNKGETEIEIGTVYFAGKGVDYSKGSIDEKIPISKFVVEGVTKDDKIIVKNLDTGKVSNIAPSDFENLNVGRESSLKNNVNANFFYEHRNEIFTYNFGKNFGKKRRGRIEYKNGKLYFVYLDPKGKVVSKLIKREDLEPQKDFKYAKLQQVGTVRDRKQKDARVAFMNSKEIKEMDAGLKQTREDRLSLISQLGEQAKEELKNITEKLAKQTEQLAKVKEDLKNIQKMKDTGEKIKLNFSKATKSFTRSLNKLTKMQSEIEAEIESLEALKDENEFNIEYFESFSKEISDSSENTEQFIKELKDQQKLLKDNGVSLSSAIDKAKKLSDAIKKAIKSATKMFRNTLKSTYIKDEDYSKYLSGLLDQVASGENLQETWPLLKQEMANFALTSDLSKDANVNESLLIKALDDVNQLTEDLNAMRAEYKARKAIIDRFQLAINELNARKAEEERLANNAKLVEQALKSGSTETQVNFFASDKKFEPTSKKPVDRIYKSVWLQP